MLNKVDEYEFISRLNLPRMSRTPAGLNFECIFCNEGKSKGRKKRGFILTNSSIHDFNTYSCRNCGVTKSFKAFLKDYSITLYEEYEQKEKKIWLENIKKKESRQVGENMARKNVAILTKKAAKSSNFDTMSGKMSGYLPFDSDILMDLTEQNGFISAKQNKQATKYCISRKIPLEAFKGFYYNKEIRADNYRYFDMLVMPFYFGDLIYGYQARQINTKRF